MMKFNIGEIVQSTAGRDKNECFIIIKLDNRFVYIANGKERKLAKPKRKNIKHLKTVDKCVMLENVSNKSQSLLDSDLRKILKIYNNI